MKVAQKMVRVVHAVLVLGVEYDPDYQAKLKAIRRTVQKRGSLLEPLRLRALRRDIQDLLVLNSEFLNSEVKYHLIHGFHKLLDRVEKRIKSKKRDLF